MFPYVVEFCTGSVCLCHTGCCVHFPGKVTISSSLFSPRVMCALSYLISCTVSWIKEVASSS